MKKACDFYAIELFLQLQVTFFFYFNFHRISMRKTYTSLISSKSKFVAHFHICTNLSCIFRNNFFSI
jgi:hypothetical protein